MSNNNNEINNLSSVDLLIKGAQVFNVFTMKFMKEDVQITGKMITGFGDCIANKIINAEGKYLIPGLIDSHMHIESTMLTPVAYGQVAIKNGVTTVFADCHEIANVMGVDGIDYILQEAKAAQVDINIMLPSSVPCSQISNDNNIIDANNLQRYYDNDLVYGLAEIMDYSRVVKKDQDYIKKIEYCKQKNLTIDGHMAGLEADEVDVLRNYNISTDHECVTQVELIERISRGVHVFIREGSAAKNFIDLMPAVTMENNHMISFCTDDISIVDLIDKGSINNIIRLGIKAGYKPELLLKMATYNAARAYNLKDKGAVAPGYIADLLLVDDLASFSIDSVYKSGVCVNHNLDFESKPKIYQKDVLSTVNIGIDEDIIDLKPKYNIAISVKNGSLITKKLQIDTTNLSDLMKIVVINRYNKSDYFTAYVDGIKLKECVIGSSISHDYHNIVIIGKNDLEIRAMIKYIKTTRGGVYTLNEGIFDYLPLDIAGLMSCESIDKTYHKFKQLLDNVPNTGIEEPFLAMSFLTLDVIPFLKITDCGLFDFETNQLLS